MQQLVPLQAVHCGYYWIASLKMIRGKNMVFVVMPDGLGVFGLHVRLPAVATRLFLK
jgi:hypothetical protein